MSFNSYSPLRSFRFRSVAFRLIQLPAFQSSGTDPVGRSSDVRSLEAPAGSGPPHWVTSQVGFSRKTLKHRDQTFQERECALGPIWQKSGSCNKLGCFTRCLNLFLILCLKSSKLTLNLLCYTAMPVFFRNGPS